MYIFSHRWLSTTATENTTKEGNGPPPPSKASTEDTVPDTEVEEAQKEPSEAEKTLKEENTKLKKELESAKVSDIHCEATFKIISVCPLPTLSRKAG